MTEYTIKTDSELFCSDIIGEKMGVNSDADANVTQEMKLQAASAYQDKVNTVLIAF